ncbi:Fatty acyl-CoA reductase 1, partial [Araneus ventricosus]
VLLEILLRCCSGINSIYILLREKKGVCPKDRKEELFKRPLFRKLRAEDPGVFSKVHVIEGDVSLPEMGMCDEDLSKIVEHVSVVFHCAASISFTKTLKYVWILTA